VPEMPESGAAMIAPLLSVWARTMSRLRRYSDWMESGRLSMRGRGCQSALIQRRRHDAAAHADSVVVTTAFGSPSQANLQRLGFSIVHTRTLWRLLDMD